MKENGLKINTFNLYRCDLYLYNFMFWYFVSCFIIKFNTAVLLDHYCFIKVKI